KRLMFFKPGDKRACRTRPLVGLDVDGDLTIAPDGTLYGYTHDHRLQAIVPEKGSFEDGNVLELDDASKVDGVPLKDKSQNGLVFRAGNTVTVRNVRLSDESDIIIIAGENIRFGEGLTIPLGTRLKAQVGF